MTDTCKHAKYTQQSTTLLSLKIRAIDVSRLVTARWVTASTSRAVLYFAFGWSYWNLIPFLYLPWGGYSSQQRAEQLGALTAICAFGYAFFYLSKRIGRGGHLALIPVVAALAFLDAKLAYEVVAGFRDAAGLGRLFVLLLFLSIAAAISRPFFVAFWALLFDGQTRTYIRQRLDIESTIEALRTASLGRTTQPKSTKTQLALVLLRVFRTVCYAAALLGAIRILTWVAFPLILAAISREAVIQWMLFEPWAALFVLAAPLGYVSARLIRRYHAVSLSQLLGLDQRPAVLMLRSFRDDTLRTGSRHVLGSRVLTDILHPRGIPFEQLMYREVLPYGPLIALGSPGETLPPLGAAREYIIDNTWQEKVQKLASDARIVIVVADATPSVAWELDTLVSMELLWKTIVVIPPVAEVDVRRRVDGLASFVETPRLRELLESQIIKEALCVAFYGDEAIFWGASKRNDWAYEIALTLSLKKVAESAVVSTPTS